VKHSLHRVNGEIVKVSRKWDKAHIDANYHEQEFGEHSHAEHELLGDHDGVIVEHVEGKPVYGEREDGATVLVSGAVTHGPEFKLTWPNGSSVTVVCADTVRAYLGLEA
jgi:hypothetical protein